MQTEHVRSFVVNGLRSRTCNADEMQPATARLGRLWADVAQTVLPVAAAQATIYGVYHHYESDASGAYDVLAGVDRVSAAAGHGGLDSVRVPDGHYLVFSAEGPMPQAVQDAWAQVWRYFADPACPHQRAYSTDFERYEGTRTVRVFIALSPT